MFPSARRSRRRLVSVLGSILILSGLLPAGTLAPVLAVSTSLVINEVDYDQPSTDTAEFLELKNVSGSAISLSGYSVVLVNGATTPAATYDTIALPAVSLAAGDYFVICANASTVLNCDLDDGPDTNFIQNGAPDAVALVQGTAIIDTVSYEGNTAAPYTEGSGTGLEDDALNAADGISRCPDGTDTDQNNADFVLRPITPGAANNCASTDDAPFVSATSPADGATGVALNTTPTITFSEPVTLDGAGVTLACTIQGTKAVSLGGGPTVFSLTTLPFVEGDDCTITILAGAVSDTDTDDPPDAMAATFSSSFETFTEVAHDLVINEVDYDQPGADSAEFVELKNVSAGAISLGGYTVELVNGTGGGATVYDTIALPAVTLAAGDWFVVCANAATVTNCDLDDDPNENFIQNGAPDGIGLRLSGTLVDALSYEGITGAPYTEGSLGAPADTGAAGDPAGLSRCSDGADTNANDVDFLLRPITPGTTNGCPGDDLAPFVSATTPANGAEGVAPSSSIQVTFSEPVDVSAGWYDITCTSSGTHAAVESGGPTAFTLDPTTDFVDGDECTVSVFAANVTDQDANDPPDAMAADFLASFLVFDACVQTFTPIPSIQGSGSAAAITGPVTTRGIVVGDFEGNDGQQGFYLQDAAGDGDPVTSDGIFVYTGAADTVSEGDDVWVSGFARERFNQTAINGSNSNSAAVTSIAVCGTGSVAPTDVTMPFPTIDHPERYEGMLVRLPQALVISEYFNYDRFGELVLALPLDGESRPFTGTAIDEPGAAANARTLANSLRRITLDDGLRVQNPSVTRHPNGLPFTLDNRFRGGDTVANTVGVLGFDFSLYRIQPTGPADYTAVNPRPLEPEPVGGTLRAAAMNTLNFFLTPDYPSGNPLDNACGPLQSVECRGADADQPDEFTRQRTKLLAALAGLDAAIVGLNEIENTTGVEPLLDPTNGIVAGLNDIFGPGTYAAIDTGTIGTDAIRVGLIYQPAIVAPVGDYAILDSSVDPRFIDTKSRPALAQTFEELATGARITVVVNHLKSKGSDCNDVGDPDAGDGQGNCSGTRTLAAQALVDWLATDPTGSGDRDVLILGDLNSYAREDPIDAIRAGSDDVAGTGDDYTNLIAQFQGTYAYSFVFDGQFGYLDHALASATLAGQVTGATEWHINADEPDLIDYDTSFKSPTQDALFEGNAFRSSDHDVVVIGLDLLNYAFAGFQPPVDGPPGLNVAKAGSGIPVKFELGGDLGLGVLFGTPTASLFDCMTNAVLDGVEETRSAGGSGLQYDPSTNTYTYVWKTLKDWATECRRFEITFDDGSYRTADVSFTK